MAKQEDDDKSDWGEQSERIRIFALRPASGTEAAFSTSDVQAAVPEASRELVDQVLSRMVKAGELRRVERGRYSSSGVRTLPPIETTGAINGASPRTDVASLVWRIAELLRSDLRPAQYGSYILPLTVLRRLDCVLEPTKAMVLKVAADIPDLAAVPLNTLLKLRRAASNGLPNRIEFYNASKFTLTTVLDDPGHLRANLENYVGGFSENVRDIFERYKFETRIADLAEKKLLYKVLKEFVAVDLHPDVVDNSAMGDAFENLIRRFNELSNETAGEHYTPRDAIRLAVSLLLSGDADLLTNPAPIRTVYDPTAGTGGMLSLAETAIKAHNAAATVRAFAQEVNDESYALCKADMLIKGQGVDNVLAGNTLSNDRFEGKTFDWMLANPPYGVDWKKVQDDVEREQKSRGFRGRFGPGLPRIGDGQMLFLLHLVSKMTPIEVSPSGSRIAIVMNGSPLFSGGAGSGESEIRRYLFEHDLIEAIVGLPTDMFYNTGIATYIWILTNNKAPERKGKVQLIDATAQWVKMRKSLGNKRREMSPDNIEAVVRVHGAFEENAVSKIFANEAFGYHMITVERPLRLNFQITPERLARLNDEKALAKDALDLDALNAVLARIGNGLFMDRKAFLKALDDALKAADFTLKSPQYKAVCQALSERDESAEPCLDAKKHPEPDADLRDTDNVPLDEEVHAYVARDVLPYSPDAWVEESKTKVGYEIPFTRHFYKYSTPRAIAAIDAELVQVSRDIMVALSVSA